MQPVRKFRPFGNLWSSILIALLLLGSVKLKDFHKFDSAATALEQTAALVEGKVTPRLSGLLDSIKDEKKVSLAVADPKLGTMSTGLQSGNPS